MITNTIVFVKKLRLKAREKWCSINADPRLRGCKREGTRRCMKRKRKKTGTIRLVLAGMLAAAVAITTAYLKIPLAFGYIHLGDALIFLSAAVLGPFAAVPAGIGSMLVDLLAGYVVYMPATFVIKFLVGLTAGFVLKRNQYSISRPAEKSRLPESWHFTH